MTKIIIIHGWGADSTSNWFPWLADELKAKGFDVAVPDFPNSQTPQLSEWIDTLQSILNPKGSKTTRLENVILVGHSLGAPFILRFLEQLNQPQKGSPFVAVKAAILVSGFERSLGFSETDNFVVKPFNWEKIKTSCDKFIVINSDDDPYIPLSIGYALAKSLGVVLTIEHNAGHIKAPGGFLAYPRVRDLILALSP